MFTILEQPDNKLMFFPIGLIGKSTMNNGSPVADVGHVTQQRVQL